MKECPQCQTVFGDDLSFCLHDGSKLSGVAQPAISGAKTEQFVQASAPTELLRSSDLDRSTLTAQLPETAATLKTTTLRPAVAGSARIPYVLIGILSTLCMVLVIALVGLAYFKGSGGTTSVAGANAAASPSQPPSPSPAAPGKSEPASATPPRVTPPATAPTGQWSGQWTTDSGTSLDIAITLASPGSGVLDGQIKWTLRKTVRPDKTDKIGLSAVEFVRGTADPEGTLRLKGYRKDDPDNVLVMLDEYKLSVSQDGRKLTGLAKNGGKWNGHLDLTR